MFLGCVLKSGRPRGPGKALQNVGGEAPHIFEGSPGPPGPDRPENPPPKTQPDCLQIPSYTTIRKNAGRKKQHQGRNEGGGGPIGGSPPGPGRAWSFKTTAFGVVLVRSGPQPYAAALWMTITFYICLRVGNRSFRGSGRPRWPGAQPCHASF